MAGNVKCKLHFINRIRQFVIGNLCVRNKGGFVWPPFCQRGLKNDYLSLIQANKLMHFDQKFHLLVFNDIYKNRPLGLAIFVNGYLSKQAI